ncbi:PAS domain S-box protein [Aggregicoccus sp. 17bor-14]|uniref:ATP-binding protein n=1 Tax=Myxococcaceae TaxID=31 RepID=UPI00129C8FC4|nr:MULTISPECIES: ATP-binding protein [Myxococcaceae]MBF5046097.1 PAS domain S-box protein [Simulacricoccus sp. 17bor-14]MRI91826.1 PAS domain S-box protein [Aggregicoccus sp. 17bor-14]
MKTDALRRAHVPPAAALAAAPPAHAALEAFFASLEEPVALLDRQGALLCANPALTRALAQGGHTLAQLAGALAERAPLSLEGYGEEWEAPLPGGRRLPLTLQPQGEFVVVRLAVTLASSVERALREQQRVESALLELGRKLAAAQGEEELVAAVARGVKALFPGRLFCLRILDAHSGALTSLYAEGRLRSEVQGPVVLKRSAVQRTQLALERLAPGAAQLVEADAELPLLFEGSVGSVSAPLVASGELFGAIQLEWPAPLLGEALGDERVLPQLANQVAVAVRNAKLIDELTFVRKYLEELLERANALIVVCNRERKIVVFNQALTKLTGFTKEEVLGQDLLSFVPEGERLRMGGVVNEAIRGRQVDGFETRIRTRAGEVRASFATSSVLNAQGEVEGVIAIGQDITAVRELERRIIQAEKLASLGQLAAGVVHEINNPMTAVSCYAEALLHGARARGPEAEAEREKLSRILENSQRVLRFTRDLVTYARPARDKPERVSLQAVLEQAAGFCEHVLTRARVQVLRDYRAQPTLRGVRGNLVQVFVNLLTNAAHAMSGGGSVTLSVSTEGSEAVVQVQDTGAGIAPEHLGHVFEPFFTTKPEGKGTGLGLSIVQGIVESHGGRIGVESPPGEGATFTVRLPLAD